MSAFTKKAIQRSFLKLLCERPINKITVKDIVEECGINRNTFYYHYSDIPALIEAIVTEETENFINSCHKLDSLEDCMSVAVSFALENKNAVLNIHNSSSRAVYESHLWSICEYSVRTYVDTNLADSDFNNKEKETLINFYKCSGFGQITDWLNGGMKSDILSDFRELFKLHRDISTGKRSRIL